MATPEQPRRAASSSQVAGLAARRVAADILHGVLQRGRPLDEQLDPPAGRSELHALAERDRALTRRLVAVVLRRLGSLRYLLGLYLARGFPADAPHVEIALLIGAAQILLLDVPNHAAVDLSVRLVRGDRRAARHAGLVNAVLRRVTESGAQRMAELDAVALDTPAWMMARWRRVYGDDTARAIAATHAAEPPLDLTMKDPATATHWAQALNGSVLPTGSVRLMAPGPVARLAGYAEGAWWVQDAAAALPARLIRTTRTEQRPRIADLCAAPGGKTAQLAAGNADITAVDRVPARLERLRANLARLSLDAVTVAADVLEWIAEPFDAVLLDAPCTATGTIRRHPDIPWRRRESDLATLTSLQRQLIDRAVELVRPGGTLVYCVCSLEPEEGPDIIADLLARDSRLHRDPIRADEIFGETQWLTAGGDLRTLPCHWRERGGLDGFYAARLIRR